MNTRLVMSGSAVVMALLGALASFMPHELLRYLQVEPVGAMPVLVQLLGAAYLGFAILNWMAKGILIGGIYARPLAMGNFLHYFAGAMALLKVLPDNQGNSLLWVMAGVYALLAGAFGWITFRHPVTKLT